MTDPLDTLITSKTPGQRGTLERDDAYDVLLELLDHCRRVDTNSVTTPTELWTVLKTVPGWETFGDRARFNTLLHTAERDHQLRSTASGTLLLRPDAPTTGGPEHVWVRLEGRCGAEVEVTGAAPWPRQQLHAPGPAWWRCTGCRANSGIKADDFVPMRAAATEHAADCRALPAPCH